MARDDTQKVVIHFEDLTPAEAGKKAANLREALLDASPDVSVNVEKRDTTTMDPGTVLLLVLGTPAVIAIAKGIAAFIARERHGTLVIEFPDGRLVKFDGNSSDSAKIAASLGANLGGTG